MKLGDVVPGTIYYLHHDMPSAPRYWGRVMAVSVGYRWHAPSGATGVVSNMVVVEHILDWPNYTEAWSDIAPAVVLLGANWLRDEPPPDEVDRPPMFGAAMLGALSQEDAGRELEAFQARRIAAQSCNIS